MSQTAAKRGVTEQECPFCGSGQLSLEQLDGAIWVACGDCHSVGPIAYSQQEAIERWRWLYADAPAYRHAHRSRG